MWREEDRKTLSDVDDLRDNCLNFGVNEHEHTLPKRDESFHGSGPSLATRPSTPSKPGVMNWCGYCHDDDYDEIEMAMAMAMAVEDGGEESSTRP